MSWSMFALRHSNARARTSGSGGRVTRAGGRRRVSAPSRRPAGRDAATMMHALRSELRGGVIRCGDSRRRIHQPGSSLAKAERQRLIDAIEPDVVHAMRIPFEAFVGAGGSPCAAGSVGGAATSRCTRGAIRWSRRSRVTRCDAPMPCTAIARETCASHRLRLRCPAAVGGPPGRRRGRCIRAAGSAALHQTRPPWW